MNVTFLNKRPLLSRGRCLLKQGRLFKKIISTRGRLIDRGACLAEGAYSVIYGKGKYWDVKGKYCGVKGKYWDVKGKYWDVKGKY